jgi:hypothetical protein
MSKQTEPGTGDEDFDPRYAAPVGDHGSFGHKHYVPLDDSGDQPRNDYGDGDRPRHDQGDQPHSDNGDSDRPHNDNGDHDDGLARAHDAGESAAGLPHSGEIVPHDGGDAGHHSTDAGLGWGDAGGFEQSLFGFLPQGADGAPIIIMPVDHLVLNHNTFIENTQIQNTDVIFNAGPGGDIDVDGDVNALSFQSSEINVDQLHQTSSSSGPELGWGDGAWGEAGGFEAVLFGHLPTSGEGPGPLVIMPVHDLVYNDNTFIHDTQVENTNIVFNANGGSIDVDGDVNAIGSQQALIDTSAAHQQLV